MFCTKCGTQVQAGDAFCGACGAPAAQQSAPQPSQRQAAQPAPQPYQPQAAAPQGGPQPSAPQAGVTPRAAPSGSSKALVIVLAVAGVLLLGGIASGVLGYLAYVRAARTVETAVNASDPSSLGFDAAATPTAGLSAETSVPAAEPPTSPADEPVATDPQPPPAAPKPASPALTEAKAIDVVGNYLDDAKQGRTSAARAVVTSTYLSRITSGYYALAHAQLRQFEVVKVEKQGSAYLVFVKETWKTGTWTNWYKVMVASGKVVIADTGTE